MTTRTRPHMEHLQRRGLARVERRWDPDHGELAPPGSAPHPVASSAPSATSGRGTGAQPMTRIRPIIPRLAAAVMRVAVMAARGAHEVAVHRPPCVSPVAGAL